MADADLLLLKVDDINVMPVNDAYGAIVLGMETSNIDTVFVDGRVRKWRGQLVDVDLEEIFERAHASREHIRTAAGWPLSRVSG
jgi:5-methylthioadenosine/S-adenosylhomocysteine deaminase